MTRKLIVVVLALVLLGMSVRPAAAITFGEPDAGEHPYVGVVLFTDDLKSGDLYVCSGTLIAPTVFLTAGHCAVDAKYAWVSFDEVPNYNDLSTWITGTGVAHPLYDGVSFPDTYDIGVILLDTPVTNVGYGELAPLGYLDQYMTKVGQRSVLFEPVGYGVNSEMPVFQWYGDRYKAVQRIINLKNSLTDGYNVMFTNNPGIGGGTCGGDSGGPILLNNTNLIVAVNSFGIAPFCKGNDYAWRVDIEASYDFLSNYVTLP